MKDGTFVSEEDIGRDMHLTHQSNEAFEVIGLIMGMFGVENNRIYV